MSMLKSIFYLFTQEILSIFFVNLNYKCVTVKEYILPVYTRNTANMFINLNYKSVTVEEYKTTFYIRNTASMFVNLIYILFFSVHFEMYG